MGFIFILSGFAGFVIGLVIGSIVLAVLLITCFCLKRRILWLVLILGGIAGLTVCVLLGTHYWSLVRPAGSGAPTGEDYTNVMKAMFVWGLAPGASLFSATTLHCVWAFVKALIRVNTTPAPPDSLT